MAHIPLAQRQARRFAVRHGLEYDDLLGPAYEGLCKAALGFDPTLGNRPSSYVVPKVQGELLHHLRDTGFVLQISHRLRELWLRAREPLARGLSDAALRPGQDRPREPELWSPPGVPLESRSLILMVSAPLAQTLSLPE